MWVLIGSIHIINNENQWNIIFKVNAIAVDLSNYVEHMGHYGLLITLWFCSSIQCRLGVCKPVCITCTYMMKCQLGEQ